MITWVENEEKIITTVAPDTADLKLYYKQDGSLGGFVEFPEEVSYMNDGTWELSTSFTLGTYMVKVVDLTTSSITHIKIHVKEKQITKQDVQNSIITLTD